MPDGTVHRIRHWFTNPSSPQEATNRPSAENANARTAAPWLALLSKEPPAASQRQIVPPSSPLAIVVPLELNAATRTLPRSMLVDRPIAGWLKDARGFG